ncbi:unannotated protein [freshwater metagenome]|uniref:Unannotated protein n=1 Tax=freshwater metagenome TaxID=449393 RepID=A0A6J7S053_9ZZZZ
MQARILERNGQAEPGATGGARPSRICSPEPIEHKRRLAGPEPDTVISNRYGNRVVVRGHRDLDRTALAVLDRVHHQIAQHPVDPTSIGLDEAEPGRQQHVDLGVLARGDHRCRVDDALHEYAQIDRGGIEDRSARIKPADLQQVGQK